MSPNLVILLQNISLKVQLLEFCNVIRNLDFHMQEILIHAVTKETWQQESPHCKVSEQIKGMDTVFIKLSFLPNYFETDFLIWWGEREEDKWTEIDLGFLPFGGLLEARIASTYDQQFPLGRAFPPRFEQVWDLPRYHSSSLCLQRFPEKLGCDSVR